jgi:hypothetical protein
MLKQGLTSGDRRFYISGHRRADPGHRRRKGASSASNGMADEAGKAQERGELFSANSNRVRAADTASLDDIGISRPKWREVRDAGTHASGLQIPKPRGLSRITTHVRRPLICLSLTQR